MAEQDFNNDATMPEMDELRMWNGRVELARRYQDQHGNISEASGGRRWDNNRRALAGDFNSLAELGPEAIDVNLVRPTLKLSLSPLTLTDPHISVNPRVEKFKDANNIIRAEKTEVELNYWMRELQVKKQVRKVTIDGELSNAGYLYMGITEKKGDAFDSGGTRRENNPNVKHKLPFVQRISPKRVLVPVGYWDLEECPWVDIMFLQPLRHVQAKYGEERTKDIPTLSVSEIGGSASRMSSDFTSYLETHDSHLVEIHNIWDKESKKVYVMVKDHKQFLEDPKAWPVDVEGFPLIHYRPEEIADDYYGTPPMTYAMPQQKELNAARTKLRKRFNRSKNTVFVGAGLPAEARESYKAGEDGELIPVETDTPLNQVVFVEPGLPPDSQALVYAQAVQQDYLTQTGHSNEQRGGGDPNIDSATASANVQRNVEIRNSARGEVVREVYVTLARKLWMLLQKNFGADRVRMVAGPLQEQFRAITITKDDLHGEFDFNMDMSAAANDIPSTRQAKAALNYKMLRNDPLINPQWLIFEWLKSQNVLNPQQAILSLRSPEEEMQLFMQGLPVEAHERDNHQEHMAAHAQQMDPLAEAIENPQSEEQQLKAQFTMALAVAHAQDHARKLQAIVGTESKPQGNPVDTNSARADVAAQSGNETEAELGGGVVN